MILGQEGAVHRRLAATLRSRVRLSSYEADEVAVIEPLIDDIVRVATALQWATFTAGDAPNVEGVTTIVGVAFAGARATSSQHP